MKYNVFFICLLPNIALANELNTQTEPTIILDTLHVSEQAHDQSPPNTTTVTKKEMDYLLIRNFEDLANRAEPGVNFNRNTQSINIRGLEQDRVLTTVDGIRIPYLNDSIRGEKGGVDSIDFSSLSQLDIERGADSLKYGSGSLGGTVNLQTLNPEDLLSHDKPVGGIIKSDYDTSDQSYGLNAAVAGRFQQTQVLIQAGKRQGHELDNAGHRNLYGITRTENNPEDNKQSNFLFKLKQQLGTDHQVGFTGEQFTRIRDINLRANQGTTFANNQDSNRELVKRQRLSMDYHYLSSAQWSLIDEANAVVYWQSAERSNKQEAYRLKAPLGDYLRNNKLKQEMAGTNADISKFVQLFNTNQKITLGGEWYQTHTRQLSTGQDNCPIFTSTPSFANPNFPLYMACSSLHTNMSDMPKAEGQQLGIYLKDEIGLVQDKVTVTPSIRYDYYRYKPNASGSYKAGSSMNQSALTTNKDDHVSGGLLVKWQVMDQLTTYAKWSQGFKSPNPSELYMNFLNSGVGYATLGNSKLKPETSNNFELGATLGDDKLGGSLNAFYSKYKNFIDSIALDNATMQSLGLSPSTYRYGVDRWENRSKVKIYGAEASAHWKIDNNWQLRGSTAWTVGKDQQTKQHLNSVAPITGLLGLDYTRDNWGGTLTLKTAAKRTKVENKNDFKAPGYGVMDLSMFWKPRAVKGLTLQAGLFNLTNKKYWNALNVPDSTGSLQPYDYYTEPQRNLRVSATYQF